MNRNLGVSALALTLMPLAAAAEHTRPAPTTPPIVVEPDPPVVVVEPEVMIPEIWYNEGDWVVARERTDGGYGTLYCKASTTRGTETLGLTIYENDDIPVLWFDDSSRNFQPVERYFFLDFGPDFMFRFDGWYEDTGVGVALDPAVYDTYALAESLYRNRNVSIITAYDDLTTWASLDGSAGALQTLLDCADDLGAAVPF